ncbi:hypothetical protein [uncultured Maribacter sp.]|uniref:hypothetical protein n=1 Tax=uncultured Maribacter sp. TaxID=431308 RepID=UPI002607C3A4|nr:hypothetical protein [uncultured Maribacter sp.]
MINNSTSKKARTRIILESFCVFFIAISPFLYKVYDYLPTDPSAVISILGIKISNNGFSDVSTYFWFVISKIIPLYLLILWFMTAKNWWYHIIIIPIAMYAFQLFEVLFDSDDVIDTENIWWVIPICMVVIPIVYFIRIKLYDRYVHGIDIEAMEKELHILKKKQKEKETKEYKEELSSEEDIYKKYSWSEIINRKLSTHNLEKYFRGFQNTLNNW